MEKFTTFLPSGTQSRQAISKAAKQQRWAKRTGEVAQLKQKSCATNSKVAQPKKHTAPKSKPAKIIPVVTDADWEEVSDNSEWLHGNSKYDQRFNEQAYKLCLLGATDEELGDFFHVDVRTIYSWKNVHTTFLQALNLGKYYADAKATQDEKVTAKAQKEQD